MQGSDKMTIQAITKNGSSSNSMASITVSTNIASWTAFSATFLTVAAGAPDSINIFITNSPGNTIGSQFDVDNFSLNSGPVGIDEQWIGTAFMVYPNPAKDRLNIVSKNETATAIIISDVLGKTVSEVILDAELTSIKTGSYTGGVYFYRIVNSEGSVIFSSKFVVEE